MLNNVIINTSLTNIVSGTNTERQVSVGLYFCNFVNSGDFITIHAIKSGELPSDANTIIKDLEFTGKETFQFPNEKFILNYGEKISASGVYGGRVSATATFIEL